VKGQRKEDARGLGRRRGHVNKGQRAWRAKVLNLLCEREEREMPRSPQGKSGHAKRGQRAWKAKVLRIKMSEKRRQ